jgi:hypothetical protein
MTEKQYVQALSKALEIIRAVHENLGRMPWPPSKTYGWGRAVDAQWIRGLLSDAHGNITTALGRGGPGMPTLSGHRSWARRST